MRLEALRDGIEDYAYLVLLGERSSDEAQACGKKRRKSS
jgi:hypothetical protein